MTDDGDDIDENEDWLIAAEYALGLLGPGEARAFEELMAVDPDMREAYAHWAENLASLAEEVDEALPPAALKARIEKALFAAEAPLPRRSLMERLGLLPAMAGGLVAALVVLWGVGLFVGSSLDAPDAVAQLVAEDNALVVTVAYATDGETLQITRTAGTAPEGRVLELWLLPSEGAPISLGILPAAAEGTLPLDPALQERLHAANCAISIEPPGGSPTGAPTGEVVAVAPIVWGT